jgi:hypothetical protein
MNVAPEEHLTQFFESLVECLEVTEVFVDANHDTSLLNIVNMLIDRGIIGTTSSFETVDSIGSSG